MTAEDHQTTPTGQRRRHGRLLDWRFLTALAALLLIAALVAGFTDRGREVDELLDQLDRERAAAAAAREQAATERDQLMANQARLLRQAEQLSRELRQLRRFVGRELGLLAPARGTPGRRSTTPPASRCADCAAAQQPAQQPPAAEAPAERPREERPREERPREPPERPRDPVLDLLDELLGRNRP